MIKLNWMGRVLFLLFSLFARRFVCQFCKISFTNMLSWKSHLNTHGNNAIRCAVCDEKFKKEKQLEKHMRMKHSGRAERDDDKGKLATTILYCELCDYYTARKGNLVKHRKTKHSSGSENILKTAESDGEKKREEEENSNVKIQKLLDDWD